LQLLQSQSRFIFPLPHFLDKMCLQLVFHDVAGGFRQCTEQNSSSANKSMMSEVKQVKNIDTQTSYQLKTKTYAKVSGEQYWPILILLRSK
jgi:hypothetical protein